MKELALVAVARSHLGHILSPERLHLGLESPDHDEGLQTRTAWPVRYASDGVADLLYLYGCFLLVNPRYRRAPLLTFGE